MRVGFSWKLNYLSIIMIAGKQIDKFEVGTVCNFVGLAFLTVLPAINHSVSVFLNPIVYKIFALIFLFSTGILYYFSPKYLNFQMIVIALDFLIFGLFQLFFAPSLIIYFCLSNVVSCFLGLSLVFYTLFNFIVKK